MMHWEWQKMWRQEFLVFFMEAEDSAEGLVKVATCEKVYKCRTVC